VFFAFADYFFFSPSYILFNITIRRLSILWSISLAISVNTILYTPTPPTMASPQKLKTTLTDLLKINHPVLLAGMNVAAGPKLAAAVTNAGGLGVIGGVSTTLAVWSARC
jgi:hypothetical protein